MFRHLTLGQLTPFEFADIFECTVFQLHQLKSNHHTFEKRFINLEQTLTKIFSFLWKNIEANFSVPFIISSAILETHYYKLLYQFPICVFVNYPCVCLPLKIGCTSKCDWVKSLLKEQSYKIASVF